MRSIKLLSVLFLLLVLGVATTHAQDQVGGTATLDVFVEVLGACEVFTEPVAFPGYDPAAGSYGDGAIYVNCPRDLSYWVALDIGQNPPPAWDARGMAGPEILAYQLFRPDGIPWGDRGMPFSTNTWETLPAVGLGAVEVFPVAGEIFAGQGAPPGYYSDLVNVTVWY